MRSYVGAACFIFCTSRIASADVNASLDWCWANNDPPASAAAMAEQLPDGNMRGTATARDLVERAKKLAKQPAREDAAVDMAAFCQWHNDSAASEIRSSKQAVLDWLSQH
jgi:hypothetical protein